MKLDIPEFKRCCYCIPLRQGLLVWGYVKLPITLLMFLFGTVLVHIYIRLIHVDHYSMLPIAMSGIILLLFLVVDMCMTTVFLIGGHQKNSKLLRVFYIYSIVLLCIIAALLLMSIVLDQSVDDSRYARSKRPEELNISFGLVVAAKFITGLVFLGIQAYMILLIRSEINKVKNNCNFKFINNATEPGCSMENKINESGP